jgi:hypothetical protein
VDNDSLLLEYHVYTNIVDTGIQHYPSQKTTHTEKFLYNSQKHLLQNGYLNYTQPENVIHKSIGNHGY